jgi:hypothetical protein
MFIAFLFRGLSLPTHEFLRGLLFVYGVQLHQFTPNSILHIACFITMCEAFLGINPHSAYGSIYLFCAAMYPRIKFTILAAPSCLFDQNLNILHLRWLNRFRIGGRSGSTLKTTKSSEVKEYGLAPFDPAKDLTKLTSWDALPSETEAE